MNDLKTLSPFSGQLISINFFLESMKCDIYIILNYYLIYFLSVFLNCIYYIKCIYYVHIILKYLRKYHKILS